MIVIAKGQKVPKHVVAINSHTEEDLVTSLLDGDVLSGVQVEAGTTWEG